MAEHTKDDSSLVDDHRHDASTTMNESIFNRNEEEDDKEPTPSEPEEKKSDLLKKESEDSILSPRPFSFMNDLLLSLNCLVHVPMWSMGINMAAFSGACYLGHRFKPMRYSLLVYLSYCWLDRSEITGPKFVSQRIIEKLRHFPGFHLVGRYFPVKLIKTVDLDAKDGPYLFLYSPHGIIGMGANTALSTNACGFDKLFPGIVRWGATLNVSFRIPFWRDWLLALGFISADKQALLFRLREKKESIVLVPGGAIEALYVAEDSFKLVGRRRGFIRLALETGAKPVPVIGFGENSAFKVAPHPFPGSFAYRLQHFLCKIFTFSTPILLSPFPQRKPINVVVGKPITFPKSKNEEDRSSANYVENCYKCYKKAVEELYEKHNNKIGNEHIRLEWI